MSSSVKRSREARAHDRQRQILVEAAGLDLADRHHLDQRQIHAAAVRPVDQVAEFVLVDALERDGVDLDREPGRLRGVDAGQHLVQLAPAGDGAEFVRLERVERDIDAPHAVRQFAGVLGELRAVGGQRQLVERAGPQMARQRREQRHDPAAHQRLAAGEAKLAHAARDEGRAEPVQLFQRQQLGLRQKVMCSAMQ